MLLFVGGSLASAFVVSHPDDYRDLHRSLIEDFYGETLLWHGLYGAESEMYTPIDGDEVDTLADLRRALDRARKEWQGFQIMMADGLLGRGVTTQRIYRAGSFQLLRFLPELSAGETHIGELILGADGCLEYLKTYRLSEAQRKRAYLLSRLAANDWHLGATADELNQTKGDLVLRLEKAGFGYLLKPHLLEAARRSKRRKR